MLSSACGVILHANICVCAFVYACVLIGKYRYIKELLTNNGGPLIYRGTTESMIKNELEIQMTITL